MTPAFTPIEIALARLEAARFRARQALADELARAERYRIIADHLSENEHEAAIGMAREGRTDGYQ